eukprot:5438189-Prymnesium_polylepis.1
MSRAFRDWQLFVEGEAWRDELRRKESEREPLAADAGPLGPKLRASRELEAFRSARQELLREAAPKAGADGSRRAAANASDIAALQRMLEATQ